MFKAIGWLLKISLFSVLVLILGTQIHWGGQTISDQVKTRVAHAERSELASKVRRWTEGVAQAKAIPQAAVAEKAEGEPSSPTRNKEKRPEPNPMEKIQSSERQKLRALIQELNSSTSADSRGSR